ncbi:MAG: SDR family NAD(P)-dependent oxidoreductase, partial [Acidobacteria bacterium]|nr:SDR family NAD(P)-dependent oxidoreductase [Acidobacteriota bacterium]
MATLPEDLFALKGRVLVVLGGATGIGQAIALAYARAGAQVVVSSRRQQAVEDTAGRLRELGSETLALTSDVQDSGSLERLRGAVMEKFGKIDGLVVSSG